MSNANPAPMQATVTAFNRDQRGRCKYTIVVNFEDQEWRVQRYYTDFMDLRNQLATSQYFEFAEALPPRHPFGLVVERVLYLKKFWMKNEAPFLKERMQALTSWLNSMLVSIGPDGVDDVDFLDRFFEAFSPGDSRAAGQADVDRSLLHLLRKYRISSDVYRKAWSSGYTYSTLATIPREKWLQWGVADGAIEGLELEFGGLRHDTFTTQMGPDGRVTTMRQDAVTGQMVMAGSISQAGSYSTSSRPQGRGGGGRFDAPVTNFTAAPASNNYAAAPRQSQLPEYYTSRQSGPSKRFCGSCSFQLNPSFSDRFCPSCGGEV